MRRRYNFAFAGRRDHHVGWPLRCFTRSCPDEALATDAPPLQMGRARIT
jgi:hypothetical protein